MLKWSEERRGIPFYKTFILSQGERNVKAKCELDYPDGKAGMVPTKTVR